MKADPNKMVSAIKQIFSMGSLGEFLHAIDWNSNLLDVDWNPQVVQGISTSAPDEEFVLWDGTKLSTNSPIRFRRWEQKVVEPHKDSMALLLFVLNYMGVIEAYCFYKYDSVNFILSRKMTPRYYKSSCIMF